METTKSPIESLANEILTLIFGFVQEAKYLAACSQVCKRWNSILDENFLWRLICARKRYEPCSRLPLKKAKRLCLLAKSKSPWKFVYRQNYLTIRNWATGTFKLSHLTSSSGFVCMDFNETNAFSIKRGRMGKYWTLETGRIQMQLEHEQTFTAAKINEKYIVLGFNDGMLRIFELSTLRWKHELAGHLDEIGTIYLYGPLVATGSEDATIRIWDQNTGECRNVLIGHRGAICALQINEQCCVSGSTDGTIKIWSLATNNTIRTLEGHVGTVFCVTFDKDYIFSGGEDSFIIQWETSTGRRLKTFSGHTSAVVSVQFDHSKIVSGSSDKTIKVWDKNTAKCLYSLNHHTSSVWNVRFNASQIMSSAFDEKLLIWDFAPKLLK